MLERRARRPEWRPPSLQWGVLHTFQFRTQPIYLAGKLFHPGCEPGPVRRHKFNLTSMFWSCPFQLPDFDQSLVGQEFEVCQLAVSGQQFGVSPWSVRKTAASGLRTGKTIAWIPCWQRRTATHPFHTVICTPQRTETSKFYTNYLYCYCINGATSTV